GANLARASRCFLCPADVRGAICSSDLLRRRVGFASLGEIARVWSAKILYPRRSNRLRKHSIFVIFDVSLYRSSADQSHWGDISWPSHIRSGFWHSCLWFGSVVLVALSRCAEGHIPVVGVVDRNLIKHRCAVPRCPPDDGARSVPCFRSVLNRI